MARRRTVVGVIAATLVAAAAAVALTVTVPSAAAATLTQVTNFGSNPGNLSMHVYVPGSVSARPGVVVAMHPCGGNGPQFYQSSEFASLADRYGFVVVYPTSTKKIGCFDNWSDASKRRGGGTDAESIVSMVQYVAQHWNSDPARVFATGSSSGGMMTQAVLALYPDVFAAGAAFMGVPFGCFPNEADYLAANSVCANGNNDKTAQQWGDLARSAYPGYTGPRPRVQLWHGTADTVVNFRNLQMAVDQWTNVLGVSGSPTSTDTPQTGWTRRRYGSQVEAITVSGAGHSLPSAGMAAYAIAFFGLDSAGPPPTTPVPSTPVTPDPTTPVTPDPTTAAPTAAVTTPPPAPSSCRVTYKADTWNSGLVANLTVTNAGSSTVNGWTLTFTLPGGQTLTQGWNASFSGATGQITAQNVTHNAAIAAGDSVTIGYQATHGGATVAPSSFILNGATCTAA
jgi:poly(hydroxyalkanoate) depolymerase family esterase